MITMALLLTFVGLLIWLIFSKISFADAWLAEVGRIMFFCGLLGWVLSLAGKAVI